MEILLDVNVLVALLWPQHAMHEPAWEWFAALAARKQQWATCAFTEAGAVRVLSNPGVSQGTLTPARVTELLRENLRRPGHKRWVMDMDWPEALQVSGIGIESHQQVTDVYLIGLAVKNKGLLATFDRVLGARSESVVVLGRKV